MALVRKISHVKLEKDSTHQSVDCTYDIVMEDGRKYLQLDTYGSSNRKMKGKKSQSIRLSPEALVQLRTIMNQHDL
jgi:hypothetical protein